MRSRHEIEHGTDESRTAAIELRAGPLTMTFDPNTAWLRHVRLGEREVLRAIYGAVRDRYWNTIVPRVHGLTVDRGDGRFRVAFDAECRCGPIDFVWRGEVVGECDEPLGSVVTTQGRQLGSQTIQILPRGPGVQTPTITVPTRSTAVNVLNQDSAFGTLMVAQPITKLIGVSVLVDLARADEGIAAAQLDKGTRDLLSGVAQAYYGLLAARRIQAALSLQADMLDKPLQVKPTAELRLAALELRKGRAEADKQIAELTEVLTQLLGLPPCTCLELVEPALPPVTVTCADQAAQHALANNPQVREAQQNITKARAGLRAAKMDCLPDVNVVGGYAGQSAADYIQNDFAFVGVTASYTFWDWGKRKEVKRQRETQIALAHHNVEVMAETVQLEARKAFLAYQQAAEGLHIANEVVKARQDAEQEAKDPPTVLAAKAATAKAQLDLMQAELNYRLAHAKLLAAIGQP